ncbi:septin SPR28 [Saccharomyces paradoxus]|uniref:Septin SPR28 n=1 Tax=Saccharomyces paradoxus TaxID=27291 RepID=A0A8B8UP70_SACPA|nr:Spr28 [Saccharomyces paradoxus]QHS72419.1 Spr28 [Saccharomyces paradoxus]
MKDNSALEHHTPNRDELRRRKGYKKGLQLSILLLGEKGSGKSTFLNNLCGQDISLSDDNNDEVINNVTLEKGNAIEDIDPGYKTAHLSPGLKLVTRRVYLNDELGVPVTLDIISFPGCGDNIDNSQSSVVIKNYLDQQFANVLKEEVRIKRNTKDTDGRPHVCLYFLKSTPRGVKKFDIELMKTICDKVNLIPIISKADGLTETELNLHKTIVRQEILENNIRVFDFKNDNLGETLALYDMDIDSSSAKSKYCHDTKIKDISPFAIVCSKTFRTNSENSVEHIRVYEWGSLVVEDQNTSDFIFLKAILLGSHLQELKDVTNNVLYENYRAKVLTDKKINYDIPNYSFIDESSRGSISNVSTRRNSSSRTLGNLDTNDESSYQIHKEIDEKNRIIEDYQRKIDLLEKMLASPDKNKV